MYSTGMLIRFLGELGTVSPSMQLTYSLMIFSIWEGDRLKIFAPLNPLLNDLASINNWGPVVQLFASLLNLALNAQLLGCLALCVVWNNSLSLLGFFGEASGLGDCLGSKPFLVVLSSFLQWLAFNHSLYDNSSWDRSLGFEHSSASWPKNLQWKHNPTRCSYLNPIRILSPSRLETKPRLRIGLSKGIFIWILIKRACSDVNAVVSTSNTFPIPFPISLLVSFVIRSNGKLQI